jgi:hypothetical protein
MPSASGAPCPALVFWAATTSHVPFSLFCQHGHQPETLRTSGTVGVLISFNRPAKMKQGKIRAQESNHRLEYCVLRFLEASAEREKSVGLAGKVRWGLLRLCFG